MSETTEGATVPVNEAAAAFEELRQEIALMRRAVAGLSAEHASIEVPDYSQTLGQMGKALNAILRTNKELAEAPALRMNAQNWAEQIAAASRARARLIAKRSTMPAQASTRSRAPCPRRSPRPAPPMRSSTGYSAPAAAVWLSV